MKRPVGARVASRLLLTLLLVAVFVAGNLTGFTARSVLAQRTTPAEFGVFWEAWDLVVEYFVDRDRVDFQTMTYGAIQGMLATLGDENHTVFFAPDVAEQQASALEGSFEGIGAYVSSEEGQFVIVAPIHGSPAEAAGIVTGDVVLAVDGTDVTGKAEWEVIAMIRGTAGTPVVLTVRHPDTDTSIEVSITRGRIDIESVLWARIPGTDLVHIQITQFAGDTGSELRTVLQTINAEAAAAPSGLPPVTGIMLDLRNNPGGYLQEALRVASQFLPEGDIILHEKDAGGNITTYRSQGSGLGRDLPLVVLVNQGSASAAEIVAGALQTDGRAKLVGMTTVGTGTVLRPFTLSDGSVLRLGVTNWLTPDYQLIKGQGVHPDMLIEQEASVQMMNSFLLEDMDAAGVRLHEDRQFQAALLWLNVQTQPARQAATPHP